MDVYRPDDLWAMQDVIQMTYDATLRHPGDITKVEPYIIRVR